MKKNTLILLAFISIFLTMAPSMVRSQNKGAEAAKAIVKETNSNGYYYEEVISVENVTKEQMFERAKQWVLSNFKTGDVNSQFDDKNFNIYTSATIFYEKYKPKFDADLLNFKLNISFKDGKYKVRIEDFIIKSSAYNWTPPTPYNESDMFDKVAIGNKYRNWLIEQTNKMALSISSALQNAIKGNNKKDNDW